MSATLAELPRSLRDMIHRLRIAEGALSADVVDIFRGKDGTSFRIGEVLFYVGNRSDWGRDVTRNGVVVPDYVWSKDR